MLEAPRRLHHLDLDFSLAMQLERAVEPPLALDELPPAAGLDVE